MTSQDPIPEYLSLEDVLSLAAALAVGPVRDLGLLDSACHRPRSGFMGQEAYPTLAAKAAALMHPLACNRALIEGNKRLALLATAVFLRINGYRLALSDDEAFDLTLAVAAGQLDAEDIESGSASSQPTAEPGTRPPGHALTSHPQPPATPRSRTANAPRTGNAVQQRAGWTRIMRRPRRPGCPELEADQARTGDGAVRPGAT